MFARAPAAAAPDLAQLKAQAAARDPAANAAVAQQFERLFGEMMVGAMRQASFGDSLFPQENGLYRQMYDKEIVKQMSAAGGLGIADMLVTQLRSQDLGADTPAPLPLAFHNPRLPATSPASLKHAAAYTNAAALDITACGLPSATPGITSAATDGIAPATTTAPGATRAAPSRDAMLYPNLQPKLPPLPAAPAVDGATLAIDSDDPRHRFIAKIWPHAERAAQRLGVPAEIIAAQAALETGWGKSTLAQRDNNLFGVKAGASWTGDTTSYPTQEFVGGRAVTEAARFRRYDGVAGSFDDYVAVLSRPRYANAVAQGDDAARFAQALQRAGYATDPQYASKLLAIANGGTMRAARAAIAAATPTDGATLVASRM